MGAGIAYAKIRDERLQSGGGGLAGFERDFDEWAGSASIKHISTGLFVFNAFSFSDTNDSNAIGAFNGKRPPLMNAWDVQFGIQRKIPFLGLNSLGETSIWGAYHKSMTGLLRVAVVFRVLTSCLTTTQLRNLVLSLPTASSMPPRPSQALA